MDCKEVRELLSAQVDAELGVSESMAVEGHLQSCSGCQTELAELADLKGWRIALVGDPLQFSAVGRGGMFGLLTLLMFA